MDELPAADDPEWSEEEEVKQRTTLRLYLLFAIARGSRAYGRYAALFCGT